ncbi:hypothetical protein [Marinomonas sp. ef1]|uniref:hypothetical protein n=1 Tax=Marinomonas sp. ef1 TaxID=2005043 RepID=UPI000C28EFF4|nr:hypothetical protein [Marinomonas sp. ef1]
MKVVNQRIKLLVIAIVLMNLTACSLFSNNGYHGGDHRGGGPTGPLTGSASAAKVEKGGAGKNAVNEDDEIYTGGDHRGGGPTGALSQ